MIEQGIKHDNGKPMMSLIDPLALGEVGKVMTYGAHKYTANNWRKGFKYSRLYDAALRHLLAHISGEDNDPESGLSHLAHCVSCLLMIINFQITRKGDDDRFKADENNATVESKVEENKGAETSGELKYFFCDEHQIYCGSENRVLISVHEKQKCHVPICDKPAQFKKAEPAIGRGIEKMYRCRNHYRDIQDAHSALYRTPNTLSAKLCDRPECYEIGTYYGFANE